MKINSGGSLHPYKACLVVKPLAAINYPPLHQLNVQKDILNGILEEVYMEQPRGFVIEEAKKMTLLSLEMITPKFSVETIRPNFKLRTVSLLPLIEISRSLLGILLSHQKYVLYMLNDGYNGQPMRANGKLLQDDGNPMKDPSRYTRLVRKLNCLRVTQLYISFSYIELIHVCSLYRPVGCNAFNFEGYCLLGAFTKGGGIISFWFLRWVVLFVGDQLLGVVYYRRKLSFLRKKQHIPRIKCSIRTKHIEVDCHLIRNCVVGTPIYPPSIQPIDELEQEDNLKLNDARKKRLEA
ncbi:LOW QUALITY PROTEIN: hypothetical protein OSB04_031183 [Centaurea solstitialis]|uniref:Uncharacterized protein n=1 Tax=Centaurea solstitialis TaxID=347529 RepID=A0AA38SLP3_9ASTR|nr:LOW QUALITY PROTEIN: hypothetical protein OSB04_031183 [Centaurea solstitialis]